MADANELGSVAKDLATEQNIQLASEVGGDFFGFVSKLFNDAFVLVSESLWWALAILFLMKLGDIAIEHFLIPVPRGKVRWVLLFLLVMFSSFLWKDLVGGFIP